MHTNKILSIGLTLTLLLLVTAGIGQAQGPAQQGQTAVEGVGVVTAATALDTSITYQGRLTDGGSPANGKYDLAFLLRDGPSSGNLVGNAVELEDVVVADGLFTVQLDFGPGAFNGDARWLQIGVRPWDSYGAHAELLPWQPLTAAPYAQFAQTIYRRTAVVRPVGTPAQNGAALLAALAGITNAAADNPYLLKLEPGQYDVGTASLKMKGYVDIEGSGELTTEIVGTGNSSSDTGTVWGANNAELRSLTVRNTGDGQGWATAIYNKDVSPHLLHVRALASGALEASIAIRNEASSATIEETLAIAYGGAYSAGVINIDASPTMIDVEATGKQGDVLTYGVYNENSSTTMREVVATADGALDDGYGVYNVDSTAATMTDVTASATAAGTAYGVYNVRSSPPMNRVIVSVEGDFAAQGVYNDGSSPAMNQVTVSATGAGANYGVLNMNSSAPDISHSTVDVSGGTFTIGINNDNSTPIINNVVVTVWSTSGSHYGVNNYRSNPRLINVTATAEGAGTMNAAVRNDESNANINSSFLTASGAKSDYGVYNTANEGSHTVWINNSQIVMANTDATIRSDAEFTILVGGSLLTGDAVNTSAGGLVRCAGVYDEVYTVVYTGSCP